VSWALWLVVAGLVAVSIALQVIGLRALRAWGVRPSRAVLALRAVNAAVAIAVVLFALWSWLS
jgi:predicted signal transduction protein with EAL and GGDEF domain